jgi:hypothetical protein
VVIASLRIQSNPQNKAEFAEVSPERYGSGARYQVKDDANELAALSRILFLGAFCCTSSVSISSTELSDCLVGIGPGDSYRGGISRLVIYMAGLAFAACRNSTPAMRISQ